MSQSIKAARAGLFAACQSIYGSQADAFGEAVLVSYGTPGNFQPSCIVAVATETRQPIQRPTMGPNRSREKTAEIDVVVSVWQGGAEEAAQLVAEKCDDLTELLDAYFRTSGQETLGGGCREAWVSNIAGPRIVPSIDSQSGSVTGRTAESVVTVSARIRY